MEQIAWIVEVKKMNIFSEIPCNELARMV